VPSCSISPRCSSLDPLLDARARRVEQAELGLEDEDIDGYTAETTLQLIFFDDEEASIDWTATDSIYGARSVLLLRLLSLPHSCTLATFSHTDTSPKHGRRPTSPIIQNAASYPQHHPTPLSTVQYLALVRPPRRPTPACASLLPWHTAWLLETLISAETRLRAQAHSMPSPSTAAFQLARGGGYELEPSGR
jgi:hypothetical protein